MVRKPGFQVGLFPFPPCEGGLNDQRSTTRRRKGKQGPPHPVQLFLILLAQKLRNPEKYIHSKAESGGCKTKRSFI